MTSIQNLCGGTSKRILFALLLVAFFTFPQGNVLADADTFFVSKSDGSGLVSPGISLLDTSACVSPNAPTGSCVLYIVQDSHTQNSAITKSAGVFSSNLNLFASYGDGQICVYISSLPNNTGIKYGYSCGVITSGIFTPDSAGTPLPATGLFAVTNTRFISLSISGTSTINVDVDYFLDENEVDSSVSSLNPTQVKFSISLRPSTTFSSQSETISNTTFGTSTVDSNFNSLADGVYDLNIRFGNLACTFNESDCPFVSSYVYSSFTISSGTLSATGTSEFYDPTSFLESGELPYVDCSITSLSGCFINTGIYLLYPNAQSLNSFGETYTTLSTKFPFAYMTDFKDSITSIYSGPTTASTTISVPFGTFGTITLLSPALIESVPFTAFIRTILGALIWIMLSIQIWRRGQTIFNVK